MPKVQKTTREETYKADKLQRVQVTIKTVELTHEERIEELEKRALIGI